MIPAGEPLRVGLELIRNREPIEGSIHLSSNQARAFTGWVELIAALESALEAAAPSPDGASPLFGTKEE